MAVAVLLELVVEVALIVHVSVATGAVNRPSLLIDPHEVDHVTAWLAENCAVAMACSETLAGLTVSVPELAVTVTVVDAVAPPLVAVAFTVHDPALAAALYNPVLDPMVPHVAVQLAAALAVN